MDRNALDPGDDNDVLGRALARNPSNEQLQLAWLTEIARRSQLEEANVPGPFRQAAPNFMAWVDRIPGALMGMRTPMSGATVGRLPEGLGSSGAMRTEASAAMPYGTPRPGQPANANTPPRADPPVGGHVDRYRSAARQQSDRRQTSQRTPDELRTELNIWRHELQNNPHKSPEQLQAIQEQMQFLQQLLSNKLTLIPGGKD